ncbi:MAG TPA: hypothetical protein VFA15_01720, partial [Nitrososphaera sp.]|nr:hypothetical protein [Nitrososphaera sp.]
TYALAPIKPKSSELTPYRPSTDTKSKELIVILKERERQESIMRGQARKGRLAMTLATEIVTHYGKEVAAAGKALREVVNSFKGDEEMYMFMRELMAQEFPIIVAEITGMRTETIHTVRAAIQWSLDVLPEKEHKTFWQRLLGG